MPNPLNHPDVRDETDRLLNPRTYLLRRIDLYNWGPFSGRHPIDIDLNGTAIIGATGSGKTTLVDALMTLICAQPKYNLASTGGHESDRDLVSYVRGKTGEGNHLDDSHIARSGKTVTAIAATFHNGEEEIRIAALLWLDGSSSAISDLKRLWIFDQSCHYDIDQWLEIHHSGGVRALKQRARETPGLDIRDNKKAYLAQLKRFFEVGDNAFILLNRAAGLKQLNSIDEIFRELVLDDNAAFQRAAEVVAGFDTLTHIHEELLIARKQHASLLPIQAEFQKQQQLSSDLEEQKHLARITPIWFAEHGQQLWQKRGMQLKQQLRQLKEKSDELERQIQQARLQSDRLYEDYLQCGGGSIESLQRELNGAKREAVRLEQIMDQYQGLMQRLGWSDEISVTAFSTNQQSAEARGDELNQQERQQTERLYQTASHYEALNQSLREIKSEIQQVKERPGSNIPPGFDQFRAQLAEAMRLQIDDLPFVAEMVEVKAEESAWRGAIERAIGSHRLRILVPKGVIKEALRWVNRRNNRLHVRLLEVEPNPSIATPKEDGFVNKLNFKAHLHQPTLHSLLARLDRHCVGSAEILAVTAHAMTQLGLMSARRGIFEKQDQKGLHQDWMTGFDNRDRLAQLEQDRETLKPQRDEALTAREAAESDQRQLQQEIIQLQGLLELSFSEIDLPTCQHEISNLQKHLDELNDPQSDSEKARRRWQEASSQLQCLSRKAEDLRVESALIKRDQEDAARLESAAKKRLGKGLSVTERTLAQKRFTRITPEEMGEIFQIEKEASEALQGQITALLATVGRSEKALVRLMSQALKIDTGALAETGTDLPDIPDYLQRLQILSNEALPEKLQRFLDYLNNSSDQGVTQILSAIDNEVSVIEERIEDLNHTMQQVDFQRGRYLRLEPKRVKHESLNTLDKAQKHLRSARMQEDLGESHYSALQQLVALLRDAAENRKKVGARALLDPRYRLQFAVSVIDREDNRVIETRSGSQGGSGGEKEIIASYILTASLSYALCPDGARRPLFGTIVLDEAFSKSSQAVAGRIVSALRQFGLHPLFVTPNKEMQLLRTHTRSAVLIHRKGMQATTTSFSWEELEAKAEEARQRLIGTP